VLPEEDLVRACAAGNPEAWRQFSQLYYDWVLRVTRSTLRRHTGSSSEADAEDAAAEVFRQLVERDHALLRSLRPPYHLKAWLAIVARRSVNKLLRKRVPAPPPKEPPPPPPDQAALAGLLGRLPTSDRLLLQLFFIDGRSYEEIAAVLGISPESVGKQKFRALEKLRALARETGFEP